LRSIISLRHFLSIDSVTRSPASYSRFHSASAQLCAQLCANLATPQALEKYVACLLFGYSLILCARNIRRLLNRFRHDVPNGYEYSIVECHLPSSGTTASVFPRGANTFNLTREKSPASIGGEMNRVPYSTVKY